MVGQKKNTRKPSKTNLSKADIQRNDKRRREFYGSLSSEEIVSRKKDKKFSKRDSKSLLKQAVKRSSKEKELAEEGLNEIEIKLYFSKIYKKNSHEERLNIIEKDRSIKGKLAEKGFSNNMLELYDALRLKGKTLKQAVKSLQAEKKIVNKLIKKGYTKTDVQFYETLRIEGKSRRISWDKVTKPKEKILDVKANATPPASSRTSADKTRNRG